MADHISTVSVHIVTYNNASSIRTCIEHLLQVQHVEYQVLVIDNNSQDETVQIIQEFGLNLIVNPLNIGYAAAHNQAIDSTDSQYILTLNPDVALEPNFLAELVQSMNQDPSCGSAVGCLLRVDALDENPKTIDSMGLYMRPNRRQGLRGEGLPLENRDLNPQWVWGADGAAAFYRRGMLEDIRIMGEVFDIDFFLHKEDIDIAWRAQLRGWSAIYVPKAIAKHIRQFRPNQRKMLSTNIRLCAVRNRYLLSIKNEIAWHYLVHSPLILFYDLQIILYLLLFERDSLQAFVSLWQLWRKMWMKRRIIQSRRSATYQAIERWFSNSQNPLSLVAKTKNAKEAAFQPSRISF